MVRARLVAPVLAALLALLAPSLAAASYGWPVKPFRRQHAIRAGFGDPRYHLAAGGRASGSFHFGVDIVAADGSPVYAVAPGWVQSRHADWIAVCRVPTHCFEYWHVRGVVRSGTHVRLHQLLGRVIRGWGHVHLSERMRGRYRDPLRRGALTPFVDHTVPTVASMQVLGPQGGPVPTYAISGPISILVRAYDTPPIVPPPPWNVALLAPESLSWRLLRADGSVLAGRTTISFANRLPRNSLYGTVYAPGTYQNKPHRPGRYLYWVAHDLNTARFPNGTYTLEILARDSRGNVGSLTMPVAFANPG